MAFPNPSHPLPMYTIGKDLEIIEANSAATTTFAPGMSLLDIVETENFTKVLEQLQQYTTVESLEFNAISKSGSILLADLYVAWSGSFGQVVVVLKDSAILKVSEQLRQLRGRLNETNFELLEAKEVAETLHHENVKLSSPFIELTDTMALIPIFGNLDEEKSEVIASTLTSRVYRSDVKSVIIDFTAVGRIEQGGLYGFEKLVSILQLYGFTLFVTGLHPNHVKEWHGLEFSSTIQFMNTLRQALQFLTMSESKTGNKSS